MAKKDPKHGELIDRILLTSPEASEVLAISERRLWALTRSGAIPHRRIGRSVRYSRDEIQAWVDGGCDTSPGVSAPGEQEAD
jgi:excisionase family DNA binding protein